MQTQKTKLTLVGEVIKTNNHKTIGVLVERSVMHPIYQKLIKSKKCYQVHDERGEAKLHDRVRIVECRPLSKTKHFRLKSILSNREVEKNKETNLEAKVAQERQEWIKKYGIQYAYIFKQLLKRERDRKFKLRFNKSPKEEAKEAAAKKQKVEAKKAKNLKTKTKKEEQN